MNSTIIRNLRLSYGVFLILLLISSIASYISINNLLSSSKKVVQTSRVISELENTLSILKDAETGQRGFLITGEEAFLEPYYGAYQKATASLNNIRQMVIDKPEQLSNCNKLEEIIVQRLKRLDNVLLMQKTNKTISSQEMRLGKELMDEARAISTRMKQLEQEALSRRTNRMDLFSTFTPLLIIFAAILAIIITYISYLKAKKDFESRASLYNQLQQKEFEMSRRIEIIEEVAAKISLGDYETRVEDDKNDYLGGLAVSLNKMAESLERSFKLLSDEEKLQTGIANLNDKMISEEDVKTLSQKMLDYIIQFTESQIGALYILRDNENLELISSYAFPANHKANVVKLGEGLVGQCALDRKPILLEDIPNNDLLINFAFGQAKPRHVIIFPLIFENSVKGVIELGSIDSYTDFEMEYFKRISVNIGISLNTSENRMRMRELLAETQAQAEELQAQHSELENLNTELEAQAQKLQASEEELKVQQEELLQANQELEERSKILEEKNQLILIRNLDIQKKAEELEQSSRYKSEFLANMSHELRTPLNSILLLSRLMADNTDKNLNDEQIEFAKVIQSSGNGLLALIDEILDLSKIEAGKMSLEFKEVPVREIIGDMKSLFKSIAREKGLDFKTSIDETLPLSITTDKLRLEQILKNLLSNALKFTSKGYVSVEVSPSLSKKNHICFSIQDTGIGIPKDKHLSIFDAFQQADGSTRRKYGGTGLGLSISKELSKLLGGTITVKSVPEKGSTFMIEIPFSPEDKLDIQDSQSSKIEKVSAEVLVSEEKEIEKKTHRYIAPLSFQHIEDDREGIIEGDKVILIVEDDINFAKALLKYTRKNNYKGIVAGRGDHGIEMAKNYIPSAILLDIQLPVKDGWEVMEELKSDPITKHIPVHIMSSMEVKKESLVKGAIDFINKPITVENMKEMFDKIEEALNNSSKKVLIIEENAKHARALAYFLETYNVNSEIKGTLSEGVNALLKKEVNCVILDMGIPDINAYTTLEAVKKNEGLENVPIIIFTGKNLSKAEESKIRQYADSIVMKTAHSYQRIIDEVALFLHLVEETKSKGPESVSKSSVLNEVLEGKTVLIADDDVRNIFSLTKALEQMKMKVLSATDGKEALKVLNENPQTDIVLMDMMMPEMDGYESTTLIRQNNKYKNLPILAVTAKAMTGDREKCIQAGASDYISKPVDIDQLISLLRVWLYDKYI